MMHLLDTEVVWELRGARAGRCDPAVAAWAGGAAPAGLFISALTLLEFGRGATEVERADKAGAAAIRRWADERVASAFEGRVLPVDAAVSRRAATLGYPDARDALFAATALEHALVLVTRHPAAYRAGRVRTLDPWRPAPEPSEADDDWRRASRGGRPWIRTLFARG